jgi:hypothetical protein
MGNSGFAEVRLFLIGYSVGKTHVLMTEAAVYHFNLVNLLNSCSVVNLWLILCLPHDALKRKSQRNT